MSFQFLTEERPRGLTLAADMSKQVSIGNRGEHVAPLIILMLKPRFCLGIRCFYESCCLVVPLPRMCSVLM